MYPMRSYVWFIFFLLFFPIKPFCSEFGNKGRAITEGQYREFISEETTSYNICVRIPSQEYTITSLVITRQFILYYIIMPCPSNRD